MGIYNNKNEALDGFKAKVTELRNDNHSLESFQEQLAAWIDASFTNENADHRKYLNHIIEHLLHEQARGDNYGGIIRVGHDYKENKANFNYLKTFGWEHVFAAHKALDPDAYKASIAKQKYQKEKQSLDDKRDKLLKEEKYIDKFANLCLQTMPEQDKENKNQQNDSKTTPTSINPENYLLDTEFLKVILRTSHEAITPPQEKAILKEDENFASKALHKADKLVMWGFNRITKLATNIRNALGDTDRPKETTVIGVAKNINTFANNINNDVTLNALQKFYVMRGFLDAYMLQRSNEAESLNTGEIALITNMKTIIEELKIKEKTLKSEVDTRLKIDDKSPEDYQKHYENYYNKLIERETPKDSLPPKPFSLITQEAKRAEALAKRIRNQ